MQRNNYSKPTILIVTGAFYPMNLPRSFRATELAKEFVRKGHKVVVYVPTNGYNYSNFEERFGLIIKDLGKLRFKKFEIRGNRAIKIIKRGFNRIMQLLFEYPDIELMFKVKKALKREKGYDLLISNAVPYPIHWGVAWSRNKKHQIAKVWVADCGDPYMGNKLDTFKKFFYFKYIEKWFSKKADFITLTTPDAIQFYYKEFIPKIKIIPQGFRFPDINNNKNFIINEVPTFAYAGRLLSGIRDPRPFLNYLSTLNTDFRFIVYSPNINLLFPYQKILKNKLVIKGFISREELLNELIKMDFLVHIEFHSSIKSNSPSKFADFAIVNRPILALNMEELNTYRIDEFLKGNYKNQLYIKNPDRFRIEKVTAQFIELIND